MENKVKDWNKFLDIREGTFTHTFRMFNPQEHSLGDTYFETEQSSVNLVPHERLDEIIKTVIHEDCHVALKREDDKLPMEVEHEIIKRLFWAMDGMIL